MSTTRTRLTAFGLSGGIAAVAGCLLVHVLQTLPRPAPDARPQHQHVRRHGRRRHRLARRRRDRRRCLRGQRLVPRRRGARAVHRHRRCSSSSCVFPSGVAGRTGPPCATGCCGAWIRGAVPSGRRARRRGRRPARARRPTRRSQRVVPASPEGRSPPSASGTCGSASASAVIIDGVELRRRRRARPWPCSAPTAPGSPRCSTPSAACVPVEAGTIELGRRRRHQPAAHRIAAPRHRPGARRAGRVPVAHGRREPRARRRGPTRGPTPGRGAASTPRSTRSPPCGARLREHGRRTSRAASSRCWSSPWPPWPGPPCC